MVVNRKERCGLLLLPTLGTVFPGFQQPQVPSAMTKLSSATLYLELRSGVNNKYLLATFKDSFPDLYKFLSEQQSKVGSTLYGVYNLILNTGTVSAKQIVLVAKMRQEWDNKPLIPAGEVEKMFQAAHDAGKDKPKFVVGPWTMRDSRDRSCLWVFHHEAGLVGKITNAQCQILNNVGPALLDDLTVLLTDPEQAARDHGKVTGSCSCCGRGLTDPVSVERGIGPICEARWFASPYKPVAKQKASS